MRVWVQILLITVLYPCISMRITRDTKLDMNQTVYVVEWQLFEVFERKVIHISIILLSSQTRVKYTLDNFKNYREDDWIDELEWWWLMLKIFTKPIAITNKLKPVFI